MLLLIETKKECLYFSTWTWPFYVLGNIRDSIRPHPKKSCIHRAWPVVAEQIHCRVNSLGSQTAHRAAAHMRDACHTDVYIPLVVHETMKIASDNAAWTRAPIRLTDD